MLMNVTHNVIGRGRPLMVKGTLLSEEEEEEDDPSLCVLFVWLRFHVLS